VAVLNCTSQSTQDYARIVEVNGVRGHDMPVGHLRATWIQTLDESEVDADD
jgi:hypothetical protein